MDRQMPTRHTHNRINLCHNNTRLKKVKYTVFFFSLFNPLTEDGTHWVHSHFPHQWTMHSLL